MKRIVGITWWKNNYGSILQAYALSELINSFEGCEYEVLKQFTSRSMSIRSLLSYVKNKGISKTLKYSINKFGNADIRRRNVKCESFVVDHIKIAKDYTDENNLSGLSGLYDYFICGSDQIWNPSITKRNSLYWLNIPNARCKIAYAPSIGVTSAESQLRKEIQNALMDFKAISCREYSGSRLINDIINDNRCVPVLDPTLLWDKSFWDQLAKSPQIKEEYVFAYILRGTDDNRKLVINFAKKMHLKLVTIPFLEAQSFSKSDKSFGDFKCVDADPGEFIGLIKNAKYVFTDSFHCMIFSCIYHRTFFSFIKTGENQMLRINDFQEWLGLGNRIIESSKDVFNLLEANDKMWTDFDRRVAEERKKSIQFLKNALDLDS